MWPGWVVSQPPKQVLVGQLTVGRFALHTCTWSRAPERKLITATNFAAIRTTGVRGRDLVCACDRLGDPASGPSVRGESGSASCTAAAILRYPVNKEGRGMRQDGTAVTICPLRPWDYLTVIPLIDGPTPVSPGWRW